MLSPQNYKMGNFIIVLTIFQTLIDNGLRLQIVFSERCVGRANQSFNQSVNQNMTETQLGSITQLEGNHQEVGTSEAKGENINLQTKNKGAGTQAVKWIHMIFLCISHCSSLTCFF